jgi:predicted AAA+ superfamily ATPase
MKDTPIIRDELGGLSAWNAQTKRKPLILRGARQVGKSTLVREFARTSGLILHEINLEKQLELDKVFSTLDIKKIMPELEGVLRTRIQPEGSLLFLDEIQATPNALAALRYFYEESDLAVIAAGSLLEFALEAKALSIPVGRVEYFYLGPLSFEDFLLARGEEFLRDLIQSASTPAEIPSAAHLRLNELQREYLLVGGLPEAVAAYAKTGSFNDVQRIHASIAETYRDDCIKYGTNEKLLILQQLFRAIPKMIGQKVKYSNLAPEYSAKTVHQSLNLLIKAGIVAPIYHSDCSGIPIGAEIDERTFKLLFIDVGLMNHICGFSWPEISNFSELQLTNNGGLAEQFIGQHLMYQRGRNLRPQLYYWLRDGKKGNAEVDYTVQAGSEILPIEVKAGKSGALKSLFQFVSQRPNCKRALRFDLNPPSRQMIEHAAPTATGSKITFELTSLPLYLTNQWARWLRHST